MKPTKLETYLKVVADDDLDITKDVIKTLGAK